MKYLKLSLKKQWFNLSDENGKTEDYREITEYWCRRLFYHQESRLTVEQIARYINNYKYYGYREVNGVLEFNHSKLRKFDHNIMTLGYPKKDDASRIKIFEHAGIEIRTGKPEWGAVEGKLYFVIKHGKRIQ